MSQRLQLGFWNLKIHSKRSIYSAFITVQFCMDPHQRCVGKSPFLMSGRRRLNCIQKCKHLHPLCDLTPMSLHAIHSGDSAPIERGVGSTYLPRRFRRKVEYRRECILRSSKSSVLVIILLPCRASSNDFWLWTLLASGLSYCLN